MKKHRLWYDAVTKQIVGLVINFVAGNPTRFPGAQAVDVDDTAIAALLNGSPYDFLYDASIEMAVPKPKFVLTADKSEAPMGGELITVKVALKNLTGDEIPWDKVQVKDIAEKAQVSSPVVAYADGSFRVRSFVPGTAQINVKEVWDGITRIKCTGGQFFKFAQADILNLKFVNGGF